MRRTKHTMLNGRTGKGRTQQHQAASLHVVRLSQTVGKLWLSKPNATREYCWEVSLRLRVTADSTACATASMPVQAVTQAG